MADAETARGTNRQPSTGRLAAALPTLVVAVPVVVAGVRVSASGWSPIGDRGFLLVRALDVFSRHTPLVGQYSTAGTGAGPAAHSAGPMEYWVLAVPTRLHLDWSIPVVAAALDAACLVGCVELARRRAGLVFAWCTALGLLAAVRSMDLVTMTDVWNPWIGLAPFALLLFATWSVLDGARRLLPLVVGLASWTMQAHLTYFGPALVLVAAAVVGGWGPGLVERWRRGGWRELRGPWWVASAWAGAAVVGIGCWALPVYQQLTSQPGNLGVAISAGRADRARLGASATEASISRAIGVVPRFAGPPLRPLGAFFQSIHAEGGLRSVTAVAALVAVAAAGWWSLAHRDRTVFGGVVVVVVALVGMAVVSATLPAERAVSVGYSFRWFTLGGLLLWLVVGLAAARAGRAWVAARGHRSVGARPAPRWGAGGAVAVAAVVVGLAIPVHDPVAWAYAPSKALSGALLRATRPGGRYLVARTGPYAISLAPALAYQLRAHGRHLVLAGAQLDAFGTQYGPTGHHCDGEVVLAPTTGTRAPGARVLRVVHLHHAPPVPATLRLELAPDRSRRGDC